MFVPGSASILHADADAFFASVEQRDDRRLRGRPVIVGAGVVLAASYEAKACGIRTAMGGRRARQLCPHAVVVPPRMSAYFEASKAVFEVFEDTTPLVEGLSIDEAFLDVRARAPRRVRRSAMSSGDPARRSSPRNVQEGLVDREPLDEGRRVLEDLEHGLARLRVDRHAWEWTTTACGQSWRARRPPSGRPGSRTPSPRSSLRSTTPPPTITGRPRRRRSSRCSTEAKKALRRPRGEWSPEQDTNICSHHRATLLTTPRKED